MLLEERDDPPEWRRSAVVPTPKKSRSGVCKMDEYSGISRIFGISSIYKAICGIIQGMLTQVVGEWNLVAEEQRGFRKGRGRRNQLLTLVLLIQRNVCCFHQLILRRLMTVWTEGSCRVA